MTFCGSWDTDTLMKLWSGSGCWCRLWMTFSFSSALHDKIFLKNVANILKIKKMKQNLSKIKSQMHLKMTLHYIVIIAWKTFSNFPGCHNIFGEGMWSLGALWLLQPTHQFMCVTHTWSIPTSTASAQPLPPTAPVATRLLWGRADGNRELSLLTHELRGFCDHD